MGKAHDDERFGMPEGQVLEFSGVTKRFGGVTAVSELTARVEPGVVTGFLGPNGAGKTTSLRMLLGLVRPTSGTATIGGVRYSKLSKPLQTVGAVLEASSFHPGRTGAAHLTVYAHAAGLPKSRVDQVLGLVGLSDAGGRKVGGYSLGMRQRLGLAYALLGDPGVLVLDEPTNGLDPEGIRWIRGFLRELAREGRTVFVSSHLLAEVQQTVDSMLIISRGRLVFQGGLDELSDPTEQATVVDSGDRAALAHALTAQGIPYEVLRSGLTVRGIEPAAVGQAAAAAGVALTSLQKRGPALEEVFLDLVNGTRVHPSAAGDIIPALVAGTATLTTVDAEADVSAEAAGEADASGAADSETEPGAEATPADDSATATETEAGTGDEAGDEAESEDGAEDDDTDADVPEADPDDVASVAAEIDAESSGAPPAAAMGAAAGAAAEEHHRPHTGEHPAFAVASTGVIDIVTAEEQADREDSENGEPGPAAEPAPENSAEDWSEPAGHEPQAEHATSDEHPSFAVASTGVIDIVTAEQSLRDQAGGGDLNDDSAHADGSDAGDPLPAGTPDEPDTNADAEAEAADDEDRPWDPYVKTESDRDADRFFAAFDEATGRAAGEPPGEVPSDHPSDHPHDEDGGDAR
jgi:ABC-type multidrug transport system ATPase subunit